MYAAGACIAGVTEAVRLQPSRSCGLYLRSCSRVRRHALLLTPGAAGTKLANKNNYT